MLAIDDVAQTIARMRDFYRQRETPLILAPVELNSIVQQALDLTCVRWSDMAHQRGVSIEVRTELAVDLPAIMGDESEIRDALANLIFNAVDAMPEGGGMGIYTRAWKWGQGQRQSRSWRLSIRQLRYSAVIAIPLSSHCERKPDVLQRFLDAVH